MDILDRVHVPDVAAEPHVFREEANRAAAQVVPDDGAVDARLIERHTHEADAADEVRLELDESPPKSSPTETSLF
jgi:hypothetical protein